MDTLYPTVPRRSELTRHSLHRDSVQIVIIQEPEQGKALAPTAKGMIDATLSDPNWTNRADSPRTQMADRAGSRSRTHHGGPSQRQLDQCEQPQLFLCGRASLDRSTATGKTTAG